jgi:hypothetical protein
VLDFVAIDTSMQDIRFHLPTNPLPFTQVQQTLAGASDYVSTERVWRQHRLTFTAEGFAWAATHRSLHIRTCVARDPYTPRSVLSALAEDSNGRVRASVALNPWSTDAAVRQALRTATKPQAVVVLKDWLDHVSCIELGSGDWTPEDRADEVDPRVAFHQYPFYPSLVGLAAVSRHFRSHSDEAWYLQVWEQMYPTLNDDGWRRILKHAPPRVWWTIVDFRAVPTWVIEHLSSQPQLPNEAAERIEKRRKYS